MDTKQLEGARTGSGEARSVRATTRRQRGVLPLVIENPGAIDLQTWATEHRSTIEVGIAQHGGILFRGFGLSSAHELEQFVAATSNAPLNYIERSSPRSRVAGNIYTSTDYPADQTIFLHNEQSYNLQFPARIYFACLEAPQSGGETPIADCRGVYERLRPQTIELFRDGYFYVRTFGGMGLSWREAFQTEDRSVVEAYCLRHRIHYEWLPNGALRTRQLRRAFARHPETGELTWFNHATFFHLTTLPAPVQAMLRKFAAGSLPNQTYLADGQEIDPTIMEELRAAYEAETRLFSWQRGDVLMLDNMLAAHGRRPFTGARRVIVGMADSKSWDDLPADVVPL